MRVLSQSESADASYRIQFDPNEGVECFCYLEPGAQVLLAPGENGDQDMKNMDEGEEVVATMGKEEDAKMEEGEMESEERDAKRQKVEYTNI